MLVATDVQYLESGSARAALVGSAFPSFAPITVEKTVVVTSVAPYEPGAFYRRELPCLRAVLDGIPGVELLVIDALRRVDALARGHSTPVS